MKKSIYGYIAALFSILVLTIVVVQFLRLDYGHRLIPNEKHEARTFDIVAGEERALSGEALQIYIHQNDDELSTSILNNLTSALDYAKLPYTKISREEIETLRPSAYSVLVLSGENTDKWPYETIKRFVEDGGRLYIAGRFIDAKWAELVGVDDFGDFKDGINGLIFEQEIFPGYVDLPQDSGLFVHSIADVELKEEADVLISAKNEPILWQSPYGKGEVMFWNTTSLTDKNSRGLMVQTLSMLFPAFIGMMKTTVAIASVLFAVFLSFSELPALLNAVAFVLFMTVNLIWVHFLFLSAAKFYQAVAYSFVAGGIVAVAAIIITDQFLMSYLTESFMKSFALTASMTLGLVVTLFGLFASMLLTFPNRSTVGQFSFYRYFDRYPALFWTSFLYNIGIWVGTWIIWFAEGGSVHLDTFRYHPIYDAAIFLSYLTIIPTMTIFVVSVETRFYERYRVFYGYVNEGGTYQQIQRSKAAMLLVLR